MLRQFVELMAQIIQTVHMAVYYRGTYKVCTVYAVDYTFIMKVY